MNFKCRSFRQGYASAFFFRVFVLLLPSAFCLLPCHSQVLDSIQYSLKKKPGFIGGFATKTTFINGFQSPIFTTRAGLNFNDHIKMGMGISWLKFGNYDTARDNTPFYLDKSFTDSSGQHTVHPYLQFRYVNLFLDYVYYKSGRWQFSIPLQFGIGDARYKYNFNEENIIESRRIVFLYEPAVAGQYKIMKWFGVGLDVGYRIMIVSNKNIGSKFNSPVYDLKMIIFWGEFHKVVFQR